MADAATKLKVMRLDMHKIFMILAIFMLLFTGSALAQSFDSGKVAQGIAFDQDTSWVKKEISGAGTYELGSLSLSDLTFTGGGDGLQYSYAELLAAGNQMESIKGEFSYKIKLGVDAGDPRPDLSVKVVLYSDSFRLEYDLFRDKDYDRFVNKNASGAITVIDQAANLEPLWLEGAFNVAIVVAGDLGGSDLALTINKAAFGAGAMTPSAVPVPAAAWLLGSGVAGLMALKRRYA